MTDIFSNYDLGRPLAVGGQGLLREATRRSDGLEVVIKKYPQMEDVPSWDKLEDGELQDEIIGKRRISRHRGYP